MTPNTAELVAIYQHIKTHPQEWGQETWGFRGACGTAFCFAGHAVIRAGAEPLWEGDDDDGYETFDHVRIGGEVRSVSLVAQAILGLTDGQAAVLFDADNGFDDIRAEITEITGVDPESAEVSS